MPPAGMHGAEAPMECLGAESISYLSNQRSSQKYISLITIMFCFNDLAFTVQVKHKINSIQILGFILKQYACILRVAISTHL